MANKQKTNTGTQGGKKNELLQQLYKAHLQYELDYFTGPQFKKRFEQEFAPLETWLQQQTLQEIIPEESAQKFAQDLWSSPEWIESIHHLLSTILAGDWPQKSLKQIQMSDLFPENIFENLQNFPFDNIAIRQQLLLLLVDQELYSRLVYDLLFNGIRDFVVEENPLTKNIPAAGKILKMGRDLVEKRMPKVGEEAERKIKSFIQPYLHRPIAHTKQFFEDPNNQKLFDQVQAELLKWAKKQKIATSGLRQKQKEMILQMTEETLKHWQKHPLAQEVLNLTITNFYKKHGHMTLPEILKAYQIPQKDLLKKIAPLAHDFFKKAQQEGHLEQVLGEHLRGFYDSPEALQIMAQSKTEDS